MTNHPKMRSSRTTTRLLATSLLAGLTLLPAPIALAQTTDLQTTVVYEGSRIRVNLSGRMRHITQEVAAAACSLNAGFDTGVSTGRLVTSRAEFDRIFTSLSHGNNRLGIPSREDAFRVKRGLTELLKVWASTSVTTLKMLTADDIAAFSDIVASNAQQQALVTQALSEEFIAEYVNPSELLAADALTVSIAGRQLKLIRQMEKESCGVLSDDSNYGTRADIDASMAMFEVSLAALKSGLPNAGVIAPPSDAIARQVAAVEALWTDQKAMLQTELKSTSGDQDAWITLRDQFDVLFSASERLVALYMLAAPGKDDAFKLAISSYATEELTTWAQSREVLAATALQASPQDADRAEGLLQIRQSQSNGIVLAAVAINQNTQAVAATKAAISTPETVVFARQAILSGDRDIYVSDAIWDEGQSLYYSQVFVPIKRADEITGVLVMDINLLPFL